MMRKLATIRTVAEIKPIEGADAIEHVRVDGWWVVGRKGEFKVGDLAVYLEIDSWVTHELAPHLSKGKEPREFNGVKGERLRSVKLRGALSQGLLLPVDNIDGTPFITGYWKEDGIGTIVTVKEGDDVTEALGIQKWEPPIPAQLAGKIAGHFPSWLRKTDQERIQNCFNDVSSKFNDKWVIEEKVDGSSMTVGYRRNAGVIDEDGIDQQLVVCSRNLSLKLDDDNNTFVRVAKETAILGALKVYGRNIGISGELIGDGVQGNKYNVKGHRWLVFDILDVDKGEYVTYEERQKIIDDLNRLGAKLEQTPLISIQRLTGETLESLLSLAESKSVVNPQAEREGLVFKNQKIPDVSFKAISNRWLLKCGE